MKKTDDVPGSVETLKKARVEAMRKHRMELDSQLWETVTALFAAELVRLEGTREPQATSGRGEDSD